MKELVVFLAKHLVNHPDAVEVKETQGDTASVLELQGRQGRPRAHHRQAGPHREVDPHHPECGRVAHQPQGRPRDHRRQVTACATPAGIPGAAGDARSRRGGASARSSARTAPRLAARPPLSARRAEPDRRTPRAARARRELARASTRRRTPAPHGRGMRAPRARRRGRPHGGRGAARRASCSCAAPTSPRWTTDEFYHHELVGLHGRDRSTAPSSARSRASCANGLHDVWEVRDGRRAST